MFEKANINADFVQDCITKSSQSRLFLERDWFFTGLFAEGIHNVYYDPDSQTIERFDNIDGELRTVDMYGLILNGLVNSVTKNAPRPEARLLYGELKTPEAEATLRVTNIFLANYYEEKNVEQVIKDVVKDGFKKNQGWVMIAFNDSDHDGLGEIDMHKEDSWGILTDPNGYIDAETGLFEGEYIIKQVLVPLDKIKTNVNYIAENRVNVEEYAQVDPNDTKREMVNIITPDKKQGGMGIVQEFYYRRWEIETIKGKKGEKDKKYQVQKYYRKVFSQSILLEDEKVLDIPAFPFFCYQAVRIDGSLDVRPWMSRVIPLNKTLDMLITKMEKIVKTMSVGRILKHKSTQTSLFTDRDGQVVEWDGIREPQLMPQSGISGDLFGFEGLINRLLQDTGMFHIESAGGGANMSGIALAQKQAGDIFNIIEPTKNLSVFVGAMFKYMISLASKKYVVTRTIYDENNVEYKIVGDVDSAPSKATKLKDVGTVKVEIVPAGVYSDAQHKEEMMQLFQMQLADPESVLEAFKVGKTRLILDRLAEEQMKSRGETPSVERALKLAEKDFASLVKGKKVPVPEIEEKQAQMAYMSVFVKNAKNQQYEPAIAERINKHIKAVMNEFGVGAGKPINPEENTQSGEIYSPQRAEQEVAEATESRSTVEGLI